MSHKTDQFGTAPLGRLILTYSTPAIAGLLVFGLNRVVGNIFVGRFLGTEALAGFTVANTVVTVVLAFVVLVGAGTAVSLSLQLGQKDLPAARKLLGASITLCLVLALPLGLICWVFRDPLLVAFGARGQALRFGSEFLGIFLFGILFQFLTNVFNSAMRAVGRPLIALTTNVLSFVANTALTFLFVVVFPLGIAGVALANVLSQGLMMVWTGSFFWGTKEVSFDIRRVRWDGTLAKGILKNGTAPFSLQMVMAVLSILTNLLVAHYAGNQGMAVMGVVFSLYFLLVMPLQGTGTGIQPILGYNHGAKLVARVNKTVRLALTFTTLLCCLELLAVFLFSTGLVSPFLKDEPEILTLCATSLVVVMAAFPFAGIPLVITSYFQSVGKARPAVGLTVFRSLFLAVPLVVFPMFWGFPGIFWSYPLTEVVMAGVSLVLFVRYRKPRSDGSMATGGLPHGRQ